METTWHGTGLNLIDQDYVKRFVGLNDSLMLTFVLIWIK